MLHVCFWKDIGINSNEIPIQILYFFWRIILRRMVGQCSQNVMHNTTKTSKLLPVVPGWKQVGTVEMRLI